MSIAQRALREFRISPIRTAAQARHRGRLTVGRGVRIKGGDRIEIPDDARLAIGTMEFAFLDARAGGFINVAGRLAVQGRVSIASGCAWEVGPGAQVRIGDGTYFSPQTQVVISTGLTVGRDCAIGWGASFLDDDRHRVIRADGTSPPQSGAIELGDHVWIGSHARILNGVRLAPDCIVAAGSVVTRSVDTPGSVLAGSPARVVRTGVNWA